MVNCDDDDDDLRGLTVVVGINLFHIIRWNWACQLSTKVRVVILCRENVL